MKTGWIIFLSIFATIGLAAAALFGLSVFRMARVSAAGFQSDGGWAWMPMMAGFARGDSLQAGCGDAGWSGRSGGRGMMGGFGMMGGYRSGRGAAGACPYLDGAQPSEGTGERLTIQQALGKVQKYLSSDDNLEIAEIMEFEENFYAVVVEKDSGKGAMELLVDPYSGKVFPEHGPNMMWNQKYGHMGRWFGGNARLSQDEAEAAAQRWLDEELPGAEVEGMGIEFYGYFTFDYAVEGRIAGMLSVNAASGDVWLHTWHGDFIAEIELDE